MTESKNNFDFLRFIAATLVILSHCYPLTNKDYEPFAFATGFETMGGVGISIFFVISGYLITTSYLKNNNIRIYFINRILRIFPALLVVILLSVFVVGPVFTELSTAEYFANSQTYKYLLTIFLYPMEYDLPGVFKQNPHGVNGSLWSLPIEFTAYIAIALLGITKTIRPTAVGGLAAFFFLLSWQYYTPERHTELFGMNTHYLTRWLALFMGGALLLVLKEQVRMDWRIVATLMALLFIASGTAWANPVFSLCMPYLVIYLSQLKIPHLHNFGRFGDFSYGLYIYAFPVQQVYVHTLSSDISVLQLFTLSFATTFLLAALSWHLIEKPVLRLKRRSIHKVD